MKSVFKKSVIAGALAIGLMVSPVTAGSAVAAEDGTVGVVGIAPFFDPTLPGDGGGEDPNLRGPYPDVSACVHMASIVKGVLPPGLDVTACYKAGGGWWFYILR